MRKLFLIGLFFIAMGTKEAGASGFEMIRSWPHQQTILSAKEEQGRYKGFVINIQQSKKYFPYWTALKDQRAQPSMRTFDLDGDKRNEYIVFLPQKHENGEFVNEAKVLKLTKAGIQEIGVSDVRKLLLKEVKYYINKQNFYVQVDQKNVLKLKNETQAPKLLIDSFVLYDVEDEQLKAKVRLVNHKGKYLGVFEVLYDYKQPAKMTPVKTVFKEAGSTK